MLLLAVLPLMTFGLLWWLTWRHRNRLALSRLSGRGVFVVTQVSFQVLLVAITETLSVGHHLTRRSVTTAWLLAAIVLAFVLWLEWTRAGAPRPRWAYLSARARSFLGRQSVEAWLGVLTITAVTGILALIGWLYRPTNTDSLVYHLTRVAHWAQDRSVAHFATHYLGQIELSPLHEFNMLHLHLLVGTDRLDGYPQLMAFVICVVGASEMARLLGADGRTQLMAAVICAVIPSLILEATSTQNNLFAASIGIAIVVIMLAWHPAGPWVGRSILLGFSFGLALLSKGTLPALLAPTALLLAIQAIRAQIRSTSVPEGARRAVSVLAVVGLAAGLVAAPFFTRNYELFHSPVGPISKSTGDDEIGLRSGAANTVRSSAVNFMIGDGRSDPEALVSKVALGALRRMYSLFGVDPNDPRYVLGSRTDAFAHTDYGLTARVEEYGANPWHVVLLVLAGGAICLRAVRGDRSLRLAALLAVGLSLGYILFSATAKWSVYVARYQEPLFVAWAPLIAIAIAPLSHWLSRVLIALLVLACLPQLLNNEARSLLHYDRRNSSDLAGYFPGFGTYQDGKEADYLSVRDAIVASGCDRVGITSLITIEYPIWAGLEHAGWKGTIQHLDVTNESEKLEDRAFRPCALLREATSAASADRGGWVETRFGTLVLSLDPVHALSTATGPP